MKFEKVIKMYYQTGKKKDKTEEEKLEYELYAIMKELLDLFNAFEIGDRNASDLIDQYELLGKLSFCYDWLKGNIGSLEEYRKTKE